MSSSTQPPVPILNVPVAPITMADALARFEGWLSDRTPNYVCCVPAHSLMEAHDHPDLLPVFQHAGLNTPDGMAVVWLLRLKGFRHVRRVYGPDLLTAACTAFPHRRHYFYGGAPGVAAALVSRLQARIPGLQVAGYESPPFRHLTLAEESDLAARLSAAGVDILWVALGSPRQERWMAAHVDRLNVPILVGVGAAFDFLAGRKPQAPAWVQRLGFEWLFRLLSEPRRLWRRYILGYPRFIFLALVDLFRSTPVR